MTYKVFYKDDQFIEIESKEGKFLVNGIEPKLDTVKVGLMKWHILKDNRSFNIEMTDSDPETKTYNVKVNGHSFDLKLQDEFDAMLHQMGMGKTKTDEMGDVKAPMPGLVLDILVKVGQTVSKGDSLLVLEAMKMENIIKATGTGIVKSVKVAKKDAVDKNQVLIEME